LLRRSKLTPSVQQIQPVRIAGFAADRRMPGAILIPPAAFTISGRRTRTLAWPLLRGHDMNARVLDGEIITSRLDDVRAYDGVRTRRILAFVIDYCIVALLTIPFAILVAVLGLLTFGLGWALYSILVPAVAILYIWNTLGGRNQATSGMRMMGIRLDRLDGTRIDGLTAVVHSVLFWASTVILTPFILLVTLFADRKRTLHDLLLGTVVSHSNR
jgi:uncharacterized RDD family membrane protein YckC